MLASGLGTVLGVLLFFRVLFRELEKYDDTVDYDLDWFEYDERN